jgi:hypothetical protein
MNPTDSHTENIDITTGLYNSTGLYSAPNHYNPAADYNPMMSLDPTNAQYLRGLAMVVNPMDGILSFEVSNVASAGVV